MLALANPLLLGQTHAVAQSVTQPSTQSSGEAAGYLGAVEGSVTVDDESANIGYRLKVGQRVKTGYRSRATLILGTQNVVHLGESAQLRIQTQHSPNAGSENTELDLIQGRIRAIVKQKNLLKKTFNIRARTVVMGVRGTHILMENPESPTAQVRLVTLEGRAEVTVPGLRHAIVLNKNEGFSTSGPPAQSGPIPSAAAAGRLEKIEPEQAQSLAIQVAASPRDIKTTADIKTLQTPPKQDGLPGMTNVAGANTSGTTGGSGSSSGGAPLSNTPGNVPPSMPQGPTTGPITSVPPIPVDPAANGGGVRNSFQVSVRVRVQH